MKNKSLKISLCAMVTALSTVVMMMTGIITIGTYTLPAIAGAIIASIVIELDRKWAVSAYVSTSMLSIFLAADKEAVIMFILFLGYYPILKSIIEKIKNKPVQWILKFGTFNISVITAYFIAMKILILPDDSFVIFGISMPLIFLAMGNIIFLLYDYTISLLVRTYILKLHPKIKKMIKK